MSRLKRYRYRESRVATVDTDAGRLLAIEPPLAQPHVPRHVRHIARQLPPLPRHLEPTPEQIDRGRTIAAAFDRLRAGGDANTNARRESTP